MDVTTFLLIIYSFCLSKVAAWLLIPYLLWTTFSIYLSWAIYSMN
ncbi:tryptophan-rich sensory protein (plasmid) [Bacillus mycoides]